eukprot:9096558-Alexandrium_andersonii.AAC.1
MDSLGSRDAQPSNRLRGRRGSGSVGSSTCQLIDTIAQAYVGTRSATRQQRPAPPCGLGPSAL